MAIKFTDVITKADWVKITILIIVAAFFWTWVWIEFQKPIIPEGFTDEYFNLETE